MTHEGPILDTVRGVSVVDCEACGFAHVFPLPDQEALDALYAETYYATVKPDYITNAEADVAWWAMVYDERLKLFEDWLQDPKRRSILDAGSGPGHFLAAARARGWQGIGFEPSEIAHAHSTDVLGVTAYRRKFDADAVAAFSDFDVVNMSEVLEHVPDPAATLRLAHQALLPGGLLLLVVPNDYSTLQQIVRAAVKDPWWVVPDQHLNYFTVQSLYALVRRCGFSVGDVWTTFPLELFVLMGLNYIGNDVVGRQIHTMRKNLELALDNAGLGSVLHELYRAFGRRGIGRDIVMLARKPGDGVGDAMTLSKEPWTSKMN